MGLRSSKKLIGVDLLNSIIAQNALPNEAPISNLVMSPQADVPNPTPDPQVAQDQQKAVIGNQIAQVANSMGSAISPEEEMYNRQLLNAQRSQLAKQEKDVNSQRALQSMMMKGGIQSDISPELNVWAMLAGDKGKGLVESYKAPESLKEKVGMLQKQNAEVSNSQDKLSDNYLNIFKEKLKQAQRKTDGGKEDKVLMSYFEKAGKSLDPTQASFRNGQGNAYRTLMAIKKVEGFRDSFKDYNSLNPSALREMYTALAATINGGSGNIAENQINELMPHTAKQRYASFKEFLLGKPTGAELKEFVEQVSHSLDAEKVVARDALADSIASKERIYDPLLAGTRLAPVWEETKLKTRNQYLKDPVLKNAAKTNSGGLTDRQKEIEALKKELGVN